MWIGMPVTINGCSQLFHASRAVRYVVRGGATPTMLGTKEGVVRHNRGVGCDIPRL